MNTAHEFDELFERLIAVGDELTAAIEEEDYERVADRLDLRAQVLERLEERSEKIDPTDHPRWDAVRERLEEQHDRIAEALGRQEARLEEELSSVRNHQEARAAYTGATPTPGRKILHEEVRG